jgi:rubrerythrin
MSEKEKETKKPRYATLEEVGDIVEERYKKIVGTKEVPDGYTKCAGCGMLIPLDKKDDCPYCTKPEPEKDDDDDGDVHPIIGILKDNED